MTNVIFDIDGCLTKGKLKNIELNKMEEIRKILKNNDTKLSFCTGRSQSYVEVMFQLLDNNNNSHNSICEHGCYTYNPTIDKVTNLARIDINNIITIIDKIDNMNFYIEAGKHNMVTLKLNKVEETLAMIQYLETIEELKEFEIHNSTTSIDIAPKGISKASAIELIMINNSMNIGIGDSLSDKGWLEKVEWVGCPNNAHDELKKIANYVSPYNDIDGTIDILNNFFKK